MNLVREFREILKIANVESNWLFNIHRRAVKFYELFKNKLLLIHSISKPLHLQMEEGSPVAALYKYSISEWPFNQLN